MAAMHSTMTAPDADQVTQQAEEAGVSAGTFSVHRQRRGHSRQVDAPPVFAPAHRRWDRSHQGHAGDEHARPIGAGRRHGAGRGDSAGAGSRDLPPASVCAARRGDDGGHAQPRRLAVGACPALVSQAPDRGGGGAGFGVQVVLEVEFSLAEKIADGPFAPVDESLCFNHRLHDLGQSSSTTWWRRSRRRG